MSTINTGNAAEAAAAEGLVQQGFEVLARNWKTKYCEVDIIASRDDVVWFIEVKYRASEKFGDGLEYVGPDKLMHLQRAASLWTVQRDYEGEYTLGAVAVTGDNLVGELIEISL